MHKLMTGAAFTKVGNGNFLGGANLFSGGNPIRVDNFISGANNGQIN